MRKARSATFVIAAKTLVIAAIVVVLIVVMYEPSIVIVFPGGFQGAFVIVKDEAGIEVPVVFFTFTVEVPPSRVVRVRSFRPFEKMHRDFVSTTRSDGTSERSLVNLVPADSELALRCRGTSSGSRNGKKYGERITYFVGTEAEAAAFDPYSIDVEITPQ